MKKNSKKITKIIGPVAIATGCLAAAPMASCSKTSIYHYDGKICDYLHEITYDDYRYDSDYETIKEAEAFGCSSVRCGNIYGRNFDYVYNDTPEFIVHVKANEAKQRHGSLAVATHFGLRENKLNAGKYDKQLELIPNLTMDGINDAGVICSSNVVSMESDGRKTINPQTNPGKPDLHVLFIVRYVLDNANSAEDAVNKLKNNVNIMGNLKNEMYIHTMIADEKSTWIVEFFRDVNSEHDHFDVVAEEYTGDEQIMTNYFVNVQKDRGHESFDNNEKFGDERYDILQKHYPTSGLECTMSEMVDLMKRVKFSKAYEEGKTEKPHQLDPDDTELLETTEWYSEKLTQSFIKTYKPMPDQSKPWQEAIEGLQKMKEAYRKKKRETADPAFWHTTHNSTYDISKGDLWVIVQEQYDLEPHKFHIDFK